MSDEMATGYTDLGWPVERRDGRVELITGTVIDALEVPCAAGILAASWWCYTEGHPDPIRGLPALPDPRHALAVIAAADRHFFVVRTGGCPWRVQDPVTTAVTADSSATVIRWHSRGSRIPAPTDPAGDSDWNEARPVWAYLPSRGARLPTAAILLHLLATAAATTRLGPHMLALDEGVLAIPVFGEPPHSPPSGPAEASTRAPTTFGFASGHAHLSKEKR